MDLRVNGITFNVAQEPPTQDIGSELLKCMGTPPDVFIVALQEVDIGLQIGALLFWDQWTQKVRKTMVRNTRFVVFELTNNNLTGSRIIAGA